MFTPTTVSLSGPAFSFLLYENSKCNFQQEGFLLGEITHKETKTITDNDQQQVNSSRIIKINSVIPCPQVHFFYNGVGKIDGDKIRKFLGDHFKDVVAWYKYHRDTGSKLTLRQRTVHKQLSELFNIPLEQFSCCLLTNEESENGATHLFSQTFVRYHNFGCDTLLIHIPNLSEPNDTYKSPEIPSKTLKNILSNLTIDKNDAGILTSTKIQTALEKHVNNSVKELIESEERLHQLEKEVQELYIKKKLNQIQYKDDEASSKIESSLEITTGTPETPSKLKQIRNKYDEVSNKIESSLEITTGTLETPSKLKEELIESGAISSIALKSEPITDEIMNPRYTKEYQRKLKEDLIDCGAISPIASKSESITDEIMKSPAENMTSRNTRKSQRKVRN